MDRNQWLLAGLLALLVLALWFFSVALSGDGGRADPDASGAVEGLESLIGALPGVGRPLTADDVEADCFDGERFVVESVPCSFGVRNGIDRGSLRFRVGGCDLLVTRQQETPDQTVEPKQAREGVIRLALDGTGATVTLLPGPCVLEIA